MQVRVLKYFPIVCYNSLCLKMNFKIIIKDLKGIDRKENKAIREAIRDARNNRLGYIVFIHLDRNIISLIRLE